MVMRSRIRDLGVERNQTITLPYYRYILQVKMFLNVGVSPKFHFFDKGTPWPFESFLSVESVRRRSVPYTIVGRPSAAPEDTP